MLELRLFYCVNHEGCLTNLYHSFIINNNDSLVIHKMSKRKKEICMLWKHLYATSFKHNELHIIILFI